MSFLLSTHTHTHQMPSYQATPAESTVSGQVTRSRSSRVDQSGTSKAVLPYSSSTSSLSQVPPTSDSRTSTLVDQEVGGDRGEESQPVVLNSLYINGTGWASQVRNRKLMLHVIVLSLFNMFLCTLYSCLQGTCGSSTMMVPR